MDRDNEIEKNNSIYMKIGMSLGNSMEKDSRKKSDKSNVYIQSNNNDSDIIEDDIEELNVWSKPSTERMITGGLWYNVLDIFGTIANTLFIMTISRLPVSDTAFLAKIETFRAFLLTFAALGFVGAGAKFYAEYIGRGDNKGAIVYARAAIRYNFLITGIPLTLIALSFVFILPNNPEEKLGFSLLVFMVFFDRSRSCTDIILLGAQRYDYWSLSLFLPTIMAYVTAVLFINQIGVIGALWAFLGASISGFILSLFFSSKIFPARTKEMFFGPVEKGLFTKLLGFNLLYALANLAYSLLIGSLLISETTVLGSFSDFETSTYYVVAGYLTLYIGIFGLVNPITQAISEAHAMQNKPLVENYIHTIIKFPLIMAIPVSILLFLLGPQLIFVMNGERYVNAGYFMILVFMPGYAFGTFASKYDNVLAGVGRPELPMIPWIVGLITSIIGIAFTALVPSDIYPFSLFPDVSLRFAIGLVSLTLGLSIAGSWIIYQTMQVFNIKVPKEYWVRPLVVSGIVALIYYILLKPLSLASYFVNQLGEFAGNFLYLVIMMFILLLLFIPLLIIFGGLSREDGRFLLNMVDSIVFLKPIIRRIKKIGKWFFEHQLLKATETHWITKKDNDILNHPPIMSIEIERINNINIEKDGEVAKLQVKVVNQDKSPIYEVKSYLKYGGLKVKGNKYVSSTFDKLEPGKHVNLIIEELPLLDNMKSIRNVTEKKDFKVNIIESNINNITKEGKSSITKENITYWHLVVECYNRPHSRHEEKSQDSNSRKSLKKRALFDYRLRWIYEETLML